jgi:hypothetical protein
MKNFQNLTPGRKRTAVVAFVLIHGFHENNFFIGIIPLTGGRINLAAPLALVAAVVPLASFRFDRNILLTAITVAPLDCPAFRNQHFRQAA